MYMAKVVGNVVATRKDPSLVGYKLMVVKRINSKCEFTGDEEVAADYVGAGIGDYVLLCKGSAVRVEEQKQRTAIDMAVIGIIDTFDA
ncbi:EutN/CcmL family microcompartment protein [Clostridium sp. BL-8]|uniref:EutN/CcmL family microcompartment protein n=1 Tax=Clostridium sp. BL-8 TaxID=349938 RepID=UPI00098C72C4|nr:EutN/CcmL family microcompartment protein [Clostridium sp. BL-8]OOM77620.1 carbon dioxide concentrating mechanism protein CcmL [Clostridium sp. BL-8]